MNATLTFAVLVPLYASLQIECESRYARADDVIRARSAHITFCQLETIQTLQEREEREVCAS